ncbi:MAG: cytochrome c oxidase subunit 3 [Cytophagales bacterium]|nr:cytochrome c oxidase subunit 3 [Armatimonadota bacterium]
MALGVHAAQVGRRKSLIGWLLATILLSFVFLGIKGVEYGEKFRERLFPGPSFDYMVANAEYASHHPAYIKDHPEYADFEKILEKRGAGTTNTAPPVEGNLTDYASVNGYRSSLPGSATLSDLPAEGKQEVLGNRAQLFFSIYFAMTGLHAIHIIIGIVLMGTIAWLAARRHPSVEDFMPTEMVGLYWHFVDIVWIFLFPLMYLIS